VIAWDYNKVDILIKGKTRFKIEIYYPNQYVRFIYFLKIGLFLVRKKKKRFGAEL